MLLYSQIPPEEASIHTPEMTAMKEKKEREDIRWVILSSMLTIENNRKSHNTKSDIRHTNRASKPGKTAHTM